MWLIAVLMSFNVQADVFSLLSGRIDGKLKVDLGLESEVSSRGKDHNLYNFSVSKTLKDQNTNSYILYAKYKDFQFKPTKFFYDNKSETIDQLKSLKLGFGYRKTTWGVFSDFGSESDTLFKDDSLTLSLTGFLEDGPWVYFLNYSNNRTFLNHWPLPGIAYKLNSNDKKWKFYIGAPFFFASWNPIKPLVFTYFTLLPYTHNLSVVYFINHIRLLGGVQTGPKSFVASFIDPERARIYYDEKSAYIGTVVPFSKRGAVVLKLNRNFSQKLSLSKSYQNHFSNEVRFSDSTTVSFDLKLNF